MTHVMENQEKTAFHIAVTGHRFIPEDTHLDGSVRQVLAEIVLAHADRPIWLYSALAAGSDQLVARVAKDFKAIELIVLLPKPQEDYLADFVSEEDRIGFRELLASAIAVIPVIRSDELSSPYQALGEFLISQADVLVTIWNGVYNAKKGGTGDVVQTALDAGIPVYWVYCPNQKPGEINTLDHEKQIGEIEELG